MPPSCRHNQCTRARYGCATQSGCHVAGFCIASLLRRLGVDRHRCELLANRYAGRWWVAYTKKSTSQGRGGACPTAGCDKRFHTVRGGATQHDAIRCRARSSPSRPALESSGTVVDRDLGLLVVARIASCCLDEAGGQKTSHVIWWLQERQCCVNLILSSRAFASIDVVSLLKL